ncbi:MAG: hypothetical protein Kow0059_05680 [Candidatus Sumerlaeia bacterium]
MAIRDHRSGRWRRRLLVALLAGLCAGALLAPFEPALQRSWPGRLVAWSAAPLIVAARGISNGAAALGGFLIGARERQARLEALEEETLRLREENARLRASNEALRRLTLAQSRFGALGLELIPARIIAFSTRWYALSCVVDAGSDDGVRPGAIALTLDGVAGVVRRCGGGVSAVQLIGDRRFRAGARVEGENAVGLVRGQGDPQELIFDPAGRLLSLKPGARVFTAGTEGSLFPEGLTLGFIAAVEKDKAGKPFARVRAAAAPDRETRLFIVRTSGPVVINWGELEEK